jgi:hypothetical protein
VATDSEKQEGFFRQAGAVVSSVYRAVVRDGTIDAFLRQGANELGTAFGKMVPDSIQVDEPGQVFNPLYSDIAADKRAHAEGPMATRLPTPGELAGSVYGDTQSPSKQPLPSAGEIAQEQQPQQDQGQERGREHSRGM